MQPNAHTRLTKREIGDLLSPEDREELIEMAHRDAEQIRSNSISGFLEYLMAAEKTLKIHHPGNPDKYIIT